MRRCQKTKSQTPSKGWVRFARVFLISVGTLFFGAPVFFHFVRETPFSMGMIVVGLFGLLLVGLGLFTSDKTAVEIAESI